MAAIVRLKRRISDEPLETILVSCCKKKKFVHQNKKEENEKQENPEEEESITTTQVLKFAGTVPDKNEEISKHIRNAIRKEKLDKEYKRHIGCDIYDQNRTLKKLSSSKNRYNIVSQFRAKQLDKIDELDNEEDKEEQTEKAEWNEKQEKLFCLYDMEQPNLIASQEEIVTCNSVPMIKEKVSSPMKAIDKAYVYDLYYINQPHFNYSWLENISYVDVYKPDDIYFHDQYSDPEDIYVDDDDDSNDESNWRNDYPDEDPHFYDPQDVGDDDRDAYSSANSDEDDILAAKLEQCFLGKEDESEEDEQRFNYYECSQFPLGYQPRSSSYEDYKKRILEEFKSEENNKNQQ